MNNIDWDLLLLRQHCEQIFNSFKGNMTNYEVFKKLQLKGWSLPKFKKISFSFDDILNFVDNSRQNCLHENLITERRN